NDPFDYDRVLIALVLEPKRLLRPVDHGRDPFASIVGAPNQMRFRVGLERLASPVGVEAPDHFPHFVLFCRCNSIVARFRQIPRFPVEGLYKADLVVDNHRLLMRESKGSVAVAHLYSGGEKGFSCLLIFAFSIASCWI